MSTPAEGGRARSSAPGVDGPRPYNRTLGVARLAATWALVGLLVAFSRPTGRSLFLGFPLVAAGEALRLWAAGHLRKTVELITSGPYRHTRNPLYLGRLLIFTGLCVMTRLPYGLSWVALLAGWAIFFGYYLPRKERVEPDRLRRRHGAVYQRYLDAVPALVPALRPWPDAGRERWRAARLLRNREHWMLAGLAAIVVLLLWKEGTLRFFLSF